MFGAMVPTTNLMTKRGENSVPRDSVGVSPQRHLQCQCLLPQRHRAAQAEPEAEPVRRHDRGSGAAQQPVLLRLLPGHAPGERARHHVRVEPDPAGARQRPFGLDPRRAVLPGQSSRRRAIPDATRAAGSSTAPIRAPSTTAPINPVALRMLQMKGADGRYLIPSPQTTDRANGLGFSSYSMPSKYNEHHFLGNGD